MLEWLTEDQVEVIRELHLLGFRCYLNSENELPEDRGGCHLLLFTKTVPAYDETSYTRADRCIRCHVWEDGRMSMDHMVRVEHGWRGTTYPTSFSDAGSLHKAYIQECSRTDHKE